MSVRISCRMTTATIGPNDAAAPAGEAHAAEDDRGHARSVYGPAPGVPMPVLAVRLRPPRAANRPIERVGRDLGAADRDAAPEGGQPVAADGVERQPEPRPPKRDPDDRDDDDQHDRRLGDPLDDRAGP